ncbi:MAG: type II toxin-antitoxin system VapC family toxin [Thermoleophilaceae bacterium]
MRRVFVDSNIFIYALGEEHRYRDPCRALVALLAGGEVAGETSTEVVQEVVHVRRRRTGDGADAVRRGREILAWGLPLHDFTRADLELSLELLSAHTELPARDAVHAATARNRGIDLILSADGDFDALDLVERIDPAAPDAIGRLRG